MELTGNGANKWEQISKKIGDLAFETDKQRDQLEKLITELVDLADHIRLSQETLTKLSGAAFKEVLREGSMMLNDEPPAITPQPINEEHTESKSHEASIKTQQHKETTKTPKTPKTRASNKKKTPSQQQLLPSEENNE